MIAVHTTRSPRLRRIIGAVILEGGLLAAAYLAYTSARVLVAGEEAGATRRALGLMRLEQQLGIFFEPTVQRWFAQREWLLDLFNWIYIWGFLPAIGVIGVYVYVRHREVYVRYWNAMLISGAIGLLLFAAIPVAPPRMFPDFGFLDTVHGDASGYGVFQRSSFVNQYAAVPSFHFGWVLLAAMALISVSQHTLVRIAAVLLPLQMLCAIIVTGNHYVLDAAAGGVVVLLGLWLELMAERGSARARHHIPASVIATPSYSSPRTGSGCGSITRAQSPRHGMRSSPVQSN